MAEPLLEEVFKVSGVPTHTFVEPNEFEHLFIRCGRADVE